MKKQCLECGDEFIGRSDKKYCSDSCRSAAHNRQNREGMKFVRSINKILKKNRRILAALNPEGKARVHRDQLAKMGFRFTYYTNVYRTKAGNTYYFCYEYGYLPTESGYYTLVIRQNYVD